MFIKKIFDLLKQFLSKIKFKDYEEPEILTHLNERRTNPAYNADPENIFHQSYEDQFYDPNKFE